MMIITMMATMMINDDDDYDNNGDDNRDDDELVGLMGDDGWTGDEGGHRQEAQGTRQQAVGKGEWEVPGWRESNEKQRDDGIAVLLLFAPQDGLLDCSTARLLDCWM